MIGTTIAGRYRIEAQIGIGGMGIVYRAHDNTLHREVALKVIAPHLMQQESARARFLREAQALAGLSHPNIVTVHDLAEDSVSGVVFIVMELLQGASLRYWMTEPARPPFATVAAQVCRALEAAHGRGVLHRDIKPENIFACTDGTIKLMDFGLARLLGNASKSQSSMVAGTIAYMAPEQLRGEALDTRTDLYALGVLFYEYLCAVTPFEGDNPGAMLLKHLTEPAPSLRTHLPELPTALDAILLRLLEKDPEARFPSAKSLWEALQPVLANAPEDWRTQADAAASRPTAHVDSAALPPAALAATLDSMPAAAPWDPSPRFMTSPGTLSAGTLSKGSKSRRLAIASGLAVLGLAAAFAVGMARTHSSSPAPPQAPASSPPPRRNESAPNRTPVGLASGLTSAVRTPKKPPEKVLAPSQEEPLKPSSPKLPERTEASGAADPAMAAEIKMEDARIHDLQDEVLALKHLLEKQQAPARRGAENDGKPTPVPKPVGVPDSPKKPPTALVPAPAWSETPDGHISPSLMGIGQGGLRSVSKARPDFNLRVRVRSRADNGTSVRLEIRSDTDLYAYFYAIQEGRKQLRLLLPTSNHIGAMAAGTFRSLDLFLPAGESAPIDKLILISAKQEIANLPPAIPLPPALLNTDPGLAQSPQRLIETLSQFKNQVGTTLQQRHVRLDGHDATATDLNVRLIRSRPSAGKSPGS